MKANIPLVMILLSCAAVPCLTVASGNPTRVLENRVGVYDSRQVAYALFWRPSYQAALKDQSARAKAARSAGNQAVYDGISRKMRADQARMHLEVFSTAPVADTDGWLAKRLAEVRREIGVARIVSKWDETALIGIPADARVDVTEAILRNCELDPAKRGVLRDIGRSQPLPLEEAQKLDAIGKL